MQYIERITEEEVTDVLGHPEKRNANCLYWQCPDCLDSKKDNLTFTISKGVLKSWCCDSCRKIYAEIIKRRHNNNFRHYPVQHSPQVNERPIVSNETHIKNVEYSQKCRNEFLNNAERLAYLEQKRGIKTDTVASVDLGIDLTKNCWVIPVYNLIQDNKKLIGFEYRSLDFDNKKIWKEPGTYSCLSPINQKSSKTEIMIVLEGFWDAYCFYQYLTERGQAEHYHIFTPSNGVNSVHSLLKNFNFTEYKKVNLYLDSDKAGIKTMEGIRQSFPFIETIIMDCGCKDFNEHYLKCISNRQKQRKCGLKL